MAFRAVFIANRGEIAVRIARALAGLGIRSVATVTADDTSAAIRDVADQCIQLSGQGVSAWLDGGALIVAARAAGCDAIHPGYGFLSEHSEFAQQCLAAGLTFIGPRPAELACFGNKLTARRMAREIGIPVLPATEGVASLEVISEFLAQHRKTGICIKALAGGGGRGIRVVQDPATLAEALQRCQSEAMASFGNDQVYAEAYAPSVRHIEVQVLGDAEIRISLGDRDCSLQRRRQKLVEIAPAPLLSSGMREQMQQAALRLADWVDYRNLGTVEFLVSGDQYWFLELNPRLQVEHTVTEAVTGVDLVQTQIQLAAGMRLVDMGLVPAPESRGHAVQFRINCERMGADGEVLPASGLLTDLQLPGGLGVRLDTAARRGMTLNPSYDSLLAKLVVHDNSADPEALMRRAERALAECRIEGVATNLPLLRALVRDPAVREYRLDTGFLEQHLAALLDTAATLAADVGDESDGPPPATRDAGNDTRVTSPVQGTLSRLLVDRDEPVSAGQVLAVVESMKMEFELKAPIAGHLSDVRVVSGQVVGEGDTLLLISGDAKSAQAGPDAEMPDPEQIPESLAALLARQDLLLDENRPDAVARRARLGMQTARKNLADLLDEGSFSEYGGLAIAAQRQRHKLSELMRQSPADGLVAGTGTVNAPVFGAEAGRCLAMAYDYTVFAGTQGVMNHKKMDRLLQLAGKHRWPTVIFAEGGGGRPGDTDFVGVAGLDNQTFLGLARLSGLVPLVAIVNGRCFAGNAALAGCCDLIIATRNSSLGMAGPAMIEGGGLGACRAEDVGPPAIQEPNGVIDILVDDEHQAALTARQYLGYFQGVLGTWEAADARLLRHLVPENRLRVYDMRQLVTTLADRGSVLELRPRFAPGMITALVRIEGRPFGLLANDPRYLGGAIDSAGADKASRFMQLCDAHDLPMVSLCDTPGFMVGPETEKTASVRHMSRMFITAASLDIPFFTVVVRKGYGLGAQAMAAGSFHAPVFTVAWPSGEFGAMGLEGAVRLGYRKELEAIADPRKRERMLRLMVRAAYQHGQAISMASFLEIDNVIDPAETRAWLLRGLDAVPAAPRCQGKKRSMIDVW